MGIVLTVTGDVSADDLGPVLPHEHLFTDVGAALDGDDRILPANREKLTVRERERLDKPVTLEHLWWMRGFPQPDGLSLDNYRLDEPNVIQMEAQRFADAGGGTIVDVTNFDLGRKPRLLRRLAEQTGLAVVAGTGHYVQSGHPPNMDDQTAEEIAQQIISEITDGIGDTSVRPGVIGEIGTSAGYVDHPNERKSVRAASLAQQSTGAVITLHVPFFEQEAHAVLDDIEDAGGNLENVIVGHLDGTIRDDDGLSYHESLADRGVFLQFDCFGKSGYRPTFDRSWPLDEDRVVHIRNLWEAGYENQILVSQDIFKKTELTAYGGHGYDYLLRNVNELFRARGFSSADIEMLHVDTPARALSFK